MTATPANAPYTLRDVLTTIIYQASPARGRRDGMAMAGTGPDHPAGRAPVPAAAAAALRPARQGVRDVPDAPVASEATEAPADSANGARTGRRRDRRRSMGALVGFGFDRGRGRGLACGRGR